jgi:PTH1 family peptidyl-tRNA hydrolase
MKLVVGLGNPGEKYKNNRHNVGFMTLDRLVEQISNFQVPCLRRRAISNEFSNSNFQNSKKQQAEVLKMGDLILAKPTTFMNSSGIAVKKLTSFYCLMPSALYVIHDDLDILLGEYKIEFAHGPKLHNGVYSIEQSLKTKDFWRVRVGVDNRDSENRIPGEEYVLQNFSQEEKVVLDQVIERLVGDLVKTFKG